MKIRFVQACALGTNEYEEGSIHELPQQDAELALALRRAVPYVEPEAPPEAPPEPPEPPAPPAPAQ